MARQRPPAEPVPAGRRAGGPARGQRCPLRAAQQRRGRRRPGHGAQGLRAGLRHGSGARDVAGLRRARGTGLRGTPGRADPRDRAADEPERCPRPPRDRPGGPTRISSGARPGRGPHARTPGRGRTPRLRRQRQPRAQDPGRRDPAAGRGGARRRRRPGRGHPLRGADGHRERPPDPARAAGDRAVPPAGRRAVGLSRTGLARRCRGGGRRHQRHRCRQQGHRRGRRWHEGPEGAAATRSRSPPPLPTWWPTRSPTPNRARPCW